MISVKGMNFNVMNLMCKFKQHAIYVRVESV